MIKSSKEIISFPTFAKVISEDTFSYFGMQSFTIIYAQVAKRQTHYLEVVAPERVYEFKSRSGHQ